MFIILYLLLSVFPSLNVSSQKRIIDLFNTKVVVLDPIKSHIDTLSFINPLNINFNVNNHHAFIIRDNIYCLNILSGQVYAINNDTLERIDNSVDHRLNIGSYVYVKNDTIFRFGGYGYWDQRDFIVYFDMGTKEWEFYQTFPNGIKINGSFHGNQIIKDDQIIFFGGYEVDPSSHTKNIKQNEVILFDFQTKEFKNLGLLIFDVQDSYFILQTPNSILRQKNNYIYEILPFENKVNTYQKTSDQFKISENQHLGFQLKDIYYLRDYYAKDSIRKFNTTIFLQNKIASSALYKQEINFNKFYFPALMTMTILVVFLIFRRIKRTKSLYLTKDGIIIKSVLHPLNDKEVKILKLIKRDQLITNQTLMTITENKNLSYTHNIRIKDHFIERLNLKLATLFNLNNLALLRGNSDIDKRIKQFNISKEFLPIITKLIIK